MYRLAKSPHGSRFVLKGAALFALWTGEPHRATRDIDLLGFGDPSEDRIRTVFMRKSGADSIGDLPVVSAALNDFVERPLAAAAAAATFAGQWSPGGPWG